MKIVKEQINEDSGLSEGLKLSGVIYDSIKTPDGHVYAASEGILGKNGVLVPWDVVKKLLNKYSN